MVRLGPLLVVTTLAGCGLQSQRARDATLPYHPTLDTLRDSPSKAPGRYTPRTRSTTARIELEGFARGYPTPIGLVYSGDGGTRTITGVEHADHPFEEELGAELAQRLHGGDGPSFILGGGVVQLAQYRFGSAVYVSTIVEVRAVRDGTEVFAARYAASAKGGDESVLRQLVADDVLDQICADDRLFTMMEGAPR